uniref:sphingolipid 4-desaturase n=1 Tax=Trichuris muris TaxID=70415 RepID=A0A5S6R6D0_TRIMR
MGGYVSRTDFEWSYTEEPHATRRKEMLKKYPQVEELYGLDPAFPYVVALMVLTQVLFAYLLKDSDWCLVLLQAYFAGGVINHSLTLAIHEISHNMAFGHAKPLHNRFYGMFANLPIVLPYSVSFKKYHLEHHRYMGEDRLDTDVPTEFEARFFNTSFRKFIWLLFQVVFYAFRPVIIYRKAISDLEVINIVIQMVFNYYVVHWFGVKALVYLFLCSFLSLGVHPTAGHFISEHYVFKPGQETYSYYGVLNLVTFNVGYHVEHHDFPNVPGHKLPLVRKMAPEYYDIYMHHTSWIWVLWQYVFNPDIGPYSRIKRDFHRPLDHSAANSLMAYLATVFPTLHVKGLYNWLPLSVLRANAVDTKES